MIYPNPHYKQAIPIFESFTEIQIVYLFGSVADGKTHIESDIDFGYFATSNVHDAVQIKLIENGFSNFSLVHIPDATLSLQFEIVRRNRVLYEKAGFDKGSFFSRIVRMYKDFQPYREVQRKYLKERILNGQSRDNTK